MQKEFQKDITVTSAGQLTLPPTIRKALKLGTKRNARVAVAKDGTITVRPFPGVMCYLGSLENDIPYEPAEKERARETMGRRIAPRDC